MAQQRLSVRKVREILRLRFESQLSRRQIARSVGCSREAVAECLRRSAAAGLGWPPPGELDEAALEARLYPAATRGLQPPLPDFATLHAELAHKGVRIPVHAGPVFRSMSGCRSGGCRAHVPVMSGRVGIEAG